MVIEGFRGSSGGGSIGGGSGGHESQLSFSGAGRPSATGFQHQVQSSSHFDRYDMDRNRNRDRDNDRYNTNNNVIHVGGGWQGSGLAGRTAAISTIVHKLFSHTNSLSRMNNLLSHFGQLVVYSPLRPTCNSSPSKCINSMGFTI